MHKRQIRRKTNDKRIVTAIKLNSLRQILLNFQGLWWTSTTWSIVFSTMRQARGTEFLPMILPVFNSCFILAIDYSCNYWELLFVYLLPTLSPILLLAPPSEETTLRQLQSLSNVVKLMKNTQLSVPLPARCNESPMGNKTWIGMNIPWFQ